MFWWKKKSISKNLFLEQLLLLKHDLLSATRIFYFTWKMTLFLKQSMEGWFFALLEKSYSYTAIKKHNKSFLTSKGAPIGNFNITKEKKTWKSGFNWKNCFKYVSKDKTESFKYCKDEVFHIEQKFHKSKYCCKSS